MEDFHRETLEEEATHATDEARMLLPGIQALLGFQLIAVLNARFADLPPAEQILHLGATLLTALAMALMMTPAAYHRQVGRGVVTRRFVRLTSRLLTMAMLPFATAIAIELYLLARLIVHERGSSILIAAVAWIVLGGLWYVLPHLIGRGAR
jgi:hypothetical protein